MKPYILSGTMDKTVSCSHSVALQHRESYKKDCPSTGQLFLVCIAMHRSFKMISLKSIVFAFLTFFAVAQSQQFQIQNWGNGEPTTNYTYKSLAAGRFTLDWVLGSGGNFVAGKGYKGSQNLFVSCFIRTRHQLIYIQGSQLHGEIQPHREFISRPVWILAKPVR